MTSAEYVAHLKLTKRMATALLRAHVELGDTEACRAALMLAGYSATDADENLLNAKRSALERIAFNIERLAPTQWE